MTEAASAAERYRARARSHAALRDAEARKSQIIARLRLATFLPGAALLVWGLTSPRWGAVTSAAALLLAFGWLVVRHARVDERVAWFDALRTVDDRAVARLARDWNALPATGVPIDIDLSTHAYAADLDIFGRASLFQWLGPAATARGNRVLSEWLLRAAEPREIAARQEATAELAPKWEWREHLSAHGTTAEGARPQDVDRFLGWAEGPPPFGPRSGAMYAAVIVITGALWITIGLDIAGLTSTAWWGLPLLAGLILSFATARTVQDAFERAGGVDRALLRYTGLFQHATDTPFAAAALQHVQRRLSADGRAAPACMRRLDRIVGFAQLRTGAALLHFPIQALTLWDFHVLFALERWRRSAGVHLRDWVAALAELDALAVLAAPRDENPGWCLPDVSSERRLVATALAHPLIPDGRRVANDVEVGPPGTLLLVTGSNMSGKSTLLRAIGINTVLAQAGTCVCAERLSLPAVDLHTSVTLHDSLERGLSYFMAALARLKAVIDAAEHERPGRVLLYLLDEILQGTNSAERGIAVRAVARHLLDAGAIGAMTTHDLNLAGEEPLNSAARLVHFTETVDEAGTMRFDYRLRPGLATSRNALRLMQLIGIDL
jgi:hypothetical protein